MLTNKTDAQASLERIQNFEEAFARIRSATGIEDIEELVSKRRPPGKKAPSSCERWNVALSSNWSRRKARMTWKSMGAFSVLCFVVERSAVQNTRYTLDFYLKVVSLAIPPLSPVVLLSGKPRDPDGRFERSSRTRTRTFRCLTTLTSSRTRWRSWRSSYTSWRRRRRSSLRSSNRTNEPPKIWQYQS